MRSPANALIAADPISKPYVRLAIRRKTRAGATGVGVGGRHQVVGVAVGHGQMSESALEQTMLDFVEGRYDVLCSSAACDSGTGQAPA